MAILAAENENRLLDVLPQADFVRLERFLLSVREKCITEDFFSLKIMCIVLFVMIRHIFFVLSLCTNALYDFYFHWLVKSSFLVSRGLLCIYNKQNNTRCLLIWNFSSRVSLNISLVRCAHSWAIELNTQKEIPYLRAPMYYSLYFLLFRAQSVPQ